MTFGTYNGGDAGIEGKLFKNVVRKEKEWELAGFVNFYTSTPDYFYTRYAGNHQQWDTAWGHQEIMHLGGYFKGPKSLLQPEYYLINNYVYLNENAYPAQHDGAISLFRLKAAQSIEWGPLFMQLEGFGKSHPMLPLSAFQHIWPKLLLAFPAISSIMHFGQNQG